MRIRPAHIAFIFIGVVLAVRPVVAGLAVDLQEDIRALAVQIGEASKENEQYAGGLIKSLILLRIETLKMTRALLEQRLLAKNYNVTITYNIAGEIKPPEPAPESFLRQIEAEIAEQKAKLAQQESENAKYRGGLVKSLILTNIATIQNTIAMLEQRKLLGKYGIPYPVPGKSEEKERVEIPTAKPVPTTPEPSGKRLEIVSIDSRVTESNRTWWRYAWRLTLKNLTDQPIRVDATVEFQDKEGFVINQDNAYGLVVPAKEEKTFTGFSLITASVAANVAKVGAKVRSGR